MHRRSSSAAFPNENRCDGLRGDESRGVVRRFFGDSVLTSLTIAALDMNELNVMDYLFLVFRVVRLLKDSIN